MKRFVLLAGLSVLPFTLSADEKQTNPAASPAEQASRESLHEARAQYREAIRSHGAQSKEAADARAALRAKRRAFHTQRRNNQTR